MSPLDAGQWAELRRRARAGEPVASLARAFAVDRRTIIARLRAPAGNRPLGASAKRKPAKPRKRASASKPRTRKPAPAEPAKSPSPRTRPASGVAARRKLLSRLYRAIDTKLKLMERRMHSEITALEASGACADGTGLSPADHERETRAFGALVKTINSVKDMQAELDRIVTGNTDTAADARLSADADRYRREIAERLARFVPPGA